MHGYLVILRCNMDDIVLRVCKDKKEAYKFLQPICYSTSEYHKSNEYVSEALENFIGKPLPSAPHSIVIQAFEDGLTTGDIDYYFFFEDGGIRKGWPQ